MGRALRFGDGRYFSSQISVSEKKVAKALLQEEYSWDELVFMQRRIFLRTY